MTLDEYQQQTKKTACYKDPHYPIHGLTEEVGEINGMLARIYRGDPYDPDEWRAKFKKELGDTLWNLSQLAAEYNFKLSDIAESNLAKLQDRAERDVLRGVGDDR